MRRIGLLLLLTTAVSGVAAGTAEAGDFDVFGSLGARIGNFNFDEGGGLSLDIGSQDIEGQLSAAFNVTPVFGLQGDLVVSRGEMSYFIVSVDTSRIDGALRAFYRQQDQFLVGGFVQAGTTEYSIDTSPGDDLSIDHVFAGLEGQLFLGNATLYGQVGRVNYSTDEYDDDVSGMFATAELRYYLEPNLKIEAHGGITSLDSEGTDATIYNLGIGAEYRLTDSPLSLFATLDHVSVDSDSSGSLNVDSNRILVGAKISFGTETMIERDRSGASLKPMRDELPFLPVLN